MFSSTPISSAREQTSGSLSRSWPQAPTLTISESNHTQIEELLFSPASPITSQLHRDRIEELLYSPTSPVNEPMPPRGDGNGFHIPQPLPRSFDELHAERCYLLDCLQTENHKSTELLRSITPLEESLIQNGERFYPRRRIKKKLGWLRRRLDESNRQERRILARLGQVCFETQARERWTQIEYERRQYETQSYYAQGYYGMQPPPLYPTSPKFRPGGYQLPATPWPPGAWQEWQFSHGQEVYGGDFWTADQGSSAWLTNPAVELPTSDPISPKDTSTTLERPGAVGNLRRPQLMHRPSSLNDVSEQLGVLSTNAPFAPVPRVKRLSLPSIPIPLTPEYLSICAITPEEKKLEVQGETRDGDQTVGFYFREGTVRQNNSE